MPESRARQKDSVRRLFASITPFYDFLNHTLSLGLDLYWRRQLVEAVAASPPGALLDLAAGTCDVSIALARRYPERRILAMDISLPMLRRGREKAAFHAGKASPFAPLAIIDADAGALPLPSGSVAALTLAFGLRNMPARGETLSEMHRALMPGGRLYVLEFGAAAGSAAWKRLYNLYLCSVMPRLAGLVSGQREAYVYLARSIRSFPRAEDLGEEIRRAGFSRVSWKAFTKGVVWLHSAEK
ncbi:MAG: ubiquinone/menaquinone biosynthesis methyltransferase [Deltaproteobacteria bacterium]|jgi:demethylmenaquinone methyltransferase/2-methoxy-6-polyprenyl-1,4-benzoquinol methylase|nr:ubiquinone/menaquinone biosynthesis methyltransferase [Deltaproteobacteria bacterium]